MKDLLELSLLLGLLWGPVFFAKRSAEFVVRGLVGLSGAYLMLALFVLPRLPG